MNLQITRPNGKVSIVPFSDAIKRRVGETYAQGELERLREKVENQNEILGFLLERIQTTDEELTYLLGRWQEKIERTDKPEQ